MLRRNPYNSYFPPDKSGDLEEAEKKKKKKRRSKYRLTGGWKAFVIMVIVLSAAVVAFLGYEIYDRVLQQYFVEEPEPEEIYEEVVEEPVVTEEVESDEGSDSKLNFEVVSAEDLEEDLLAEAATLAQMYDYDGAIACLERSSYFSSEVELQETAAGYRAEQEACVAWEPEQVTHIYFHSLIVDSAKAFDDDAMSSGYDQYMCTIDEFNEIIQTMYDEGYVMVSLHDICTVNEDGTVEPQTIYLPEGKKPFVLSQDDVNYYHYMDGDGFAQKLVLTDAGEVKNTYVEDDGTVSVGDYDVVPLIDTFVEEHPDFSYHGHKGTIAVSGYEGVLGYRTDEVYQTRDESKMTTYQRVFFEENPDFNEDSWLNEVYDATQVADAMKAEGWEFACHTWGHVDPLNDGYTAFVQDINSWVENVEPIVGKTDIVLFAPNVDIAADDSPYAEDNEYYQYLEDLGFDIFCIVDSDQYFVQFNGSSMRMGRRSVNGYRMYYSPESLSDLFSVDSVWDDSRPTPVPEI